MTQKTTAPTTPELNKPFPPPQTRWCYGALVMANINGSIGYGRIAYIDELADFVEVHAYDLSTTTAELYIWAGTRKEYEELWTFAPSAGDT